MIDHVDFAVTDVAGSRAFYVAALAPLGLCPVVEFDREDGRKGTGFGQGEIGVFFGGGVRVGGRLHVSFRAASAEAVDRFFDAALAAGGSEHGRPGMWPRYGEHYYAAFVRDPDGHVIETVFRGSKAAASS